MKPGTKSLQRIVIVTPIPNKIKVKGSKWYAYKASLRDVTHAASEASPDVQTRRQR